MLLFSPNTLSKGDRRVAVPETADRDIATDNVTTCHEQFVSSQIKGGPPPALSKSQIQIGTHSTQINTPRRAVLSRSKACSLSS